MGFYAWKPYVPVAERRKQAAQRLAKLQKKGQAAAPVVIEGRTIARSFWGKSWCTNLERYSDYANRLPRGRAYARNGSVLDLKIAKGEVVAMVSGSDLYTIKIAIAPVAASRWQAICKDCAGSIDTLVELLQGRLAKGVMDRVCQPGDGLFPAPGEIKLSCSCPDSASMCKHVASALYGVGARLDEKPELLFVLRGVDEKDLIANAVSDGMLEPLAPASTKVLADDDVATLFGLDMAVAPAVATPVTHEPSKPSKMAERPKVAGSRKASRAKAVEVTRKSAARSSPTGRGTSASRKPRQ